MRKSTAIALSAYMVESREGWPPSFEDVHSDRLERLGHLVTALGLDAVGYDRLVVLARRVIASRTFPVLQRAIADAAIAKNRLESDDLHELVKHLNPTGETTAMTDKTDDGDRVWKEWANRHLVESTASTAARCPQQLQAPRQEGGSPDRGPASRVQDPPHPSHCSGRPRSQQEPVESLAAKTPTRVRHADTAMATASARRKHLAPIEIASFEC
jgi:hypothetical protein